MYFTLDAACLCKTGKVRKRNEDNFYFNGRSLPFGNTGLKHPVTMTKELSRETLLAVFDGMGGENAGDIASTLAVETIVHRIRTGWHRNMQPASVKNLLLTSITAANICVYDLAQSEEIYRGMGTTVVCGVTDYDLAAQFDSATCLSEGARAQRDAYLRRHAEREVA